MIPMGEDRTIELIVQRIENGELPVAARSASTAKAQARLEKRKARLYKKYGLPLEPAARELAPLSRRDRLLHHVVVH